jgi:hypothetical protein
MQFGKIHGVALVILGTVLLCIQAMLYFTPKEVSGGAIETSITKTERKTNPVAGILGVVSLIAGIAIFSTARRADEPEAKHAVR